MRRMGVAMDRYLERLQWLHIRSGEGQSSRALALLTGYSHTTVNDALTGARFPSWDVTRKLTDVFGGDMDDMFDLWQAARAERRAGVRAANTADDTLNLIALGNELLLNPGLSPGRRKILGRHLAAYSNSLFYLARSYGAAAMELSGLLDPLNEEDVAMEQEEIPVDPDAP